MDFRVPVETVSYLFRSTLSNTQANMDALSGTVLGQGIDYFEAEKYELAAKCFKQAAALSPASDNAFNAYNYLGQAYIKMEDKEAAIKTYQEAIRTFPTSGDDTFHVALGDLYLQDGNLDEAIETYENAVRIDPNNDASRYSLAESYLQSGDFRKAREQFSQVVRISPNDSAGYYGLGEVARAEGNLSEAVSMLEKSIRLNKNFELSYRELGYAYADMGEFAKAEEQLSVLKANSSDYASDLENYMAQVAPAKISAAVSLDGFRTSLGPSTQVSRLNSTLTKANASKLFSVTFTFSKQMDASSVINSKNWTITRANLRDNGGVYNYGLTPPSTEVMLDYNPSYVLYDEESNVATVYFRVSQNDTADATIDPNHIVFKFSGVDAYDKAMDATADAYSGFSGIA